MAEQPFRDAEAWLAERGVRRDPLRVRPVEEPAPETPAAGASAGVDAATAAGPSRAAPSADHGTAPPSAPPAEVSAREAVRLARASADESLRAADQDAADPQRRGEPRLEDEVAEAVAFVRRSTANAPQAEGRLAAKLTDRGWPPAVVEQALARCRDARLVDDEAMAAALVEEGRRKGHAETRLRADLRRRELADEVIDRVLAPLTHEDPEAAAFAVARQKADTLTGVSAETAFRRIVGHLARRGHPEALAHKVARAAVFDARDEQRIAGH
jgi:regulatory protein